MDQVDHKNINYYLCKWLATILLWSVSASVIATPEETRDPREFFFAQSFGDLPEEIELAREQGKLGLLLFFEAEGCPYCVSMLRSVLSQKQVQDWYQERFLSIAVDIHGDVEIKDFDGITLPSKVFAQQRRVLMTPLLAFIDLDGNEVFRHLGMVKSPEKLLVMGEYIAGGHYFDTEFSVYAEKQGLGNQQGILVTPMNESTNSGVEK